MKRKLSGRTYAMASILALGACLIAGFVAVRDRAIQATLLRVPADDVASVPALLRYALPRGDHAYARHCSNCHGASLSGDPVRGIPDLTDTDWLYGSGRVSEIERVILYGIRSGNPKGWDLAGMPAFATAHPYPAYAMQPLSPRDVSDVTAYVAAFQQTPSDPAAARHGAVVFHKNGMCFDCHGGDARGDPAIGAPNLTDSVWLYGHGSMDDIERSVTHGLAGTCPAWIGRLDFATIRSIAVYVSSKGARTAHERT
jgi:cytochrome c oxidase cbb3-type subunit 3